MNLRSKKALLALLAVLTVPAMSACVMLPGVAGDDTDTTQTDVETDADETTETEPEESDADETDADETDDSDAQASGDARFSSSNDFFAQVAASMETCSHTEEMDIPEGLDVLEPKLAGAVYAFCTFSSGDQLIAILLADPKEDMVDTQLSSDRDVADFKREGGVNTLAIGGNWLITSVEDQLVEDAVAAFGGSIY